MERPYRVDWGGAGERTQMFAKRGHAFKAPLLSGGVFDFGKVLERKPAVLVFWASWCKPCLAEAPHLVALHRKYAAKSVAFAAVSIDEKDALPELRAVVKKLKLPYPIPLDPKGEVLAKYAKGASIPLVFVVDRTGTVVYTHRNFKPGDEVGLETAIFATLE